MQSGRTISTVPRRHFAILESDSASRMGLHVFDAIRNSQRGSFPPGRRGSLFGIWPLVLRGGVTLGLLDVPGSPDETYAVHHDCSF